MRTILVLLLALCASARAGTITVDDLVPGALVTIADWRGERTARADAKGIATFENVPVGTYRVYSRDHVRVMLLDRDTQVTWSFDRRYLTDLPPVMQTHDRLAAMGAPANRAGEDRYIIEGIETSGVRDRATYLALPAELLDAVHVMRGGLSAASGRSLGGIVEAELRRGTNDWHGSVFGAVQPGELERGGADLGGPIIRDHLWIYAGIAPSRATIAATTLARGEVAHDDVTRVVPVVARLDLDIGEQHAALSVVGQTLEAAAGTGSTVAATAWWNGRFNDGDSMLSVATTHLRTREALDGEERGLAHVAVLHRFSDHQIRAGIEGALGRSRIASQERAAFVEDRWTPLHHLVIEAGVRYEGQQLGEVALQGIGPRAGVLWDPTSIGRARLFAHAARYHALRGTDDAPVVAMPYVDELVAGGAYEVLPDLTLGATWQHRAPGGDAPATDAVTVTAARRFSQLFLLASYTLERAANALQIDASYAHSIGANTLVLGGRARAFSGEPATLDAHVAYRRAIDRGVTAEIFVDSRYAPRAVALGGRITF